MHHAPAHVDRCALALVSALVLLLGSIQRAGAAEPAVPAKGWENVSEAFTKQLGALKTDDTRFLNGCQGLIVTPTGDLVLLTASQGVCVSRDQGATWTVVEGNGISGRCEDSCGFSIAYPYDGRMALFAYDGKGGTSGGMSLDGARTWKPFAQYKRGMQTADVDWSARDGATIFGVTHEPFFTVVSADGGTSWRQLDPRERGGEMTCLPGVIDAKTLTRYDLLTGSMDLSEDAGLTWSPVAHYRVTGRRPVHYGRQLYWTTAKGVITSADGKDWTLTGRGAEGAQHGPYFGLSDQEFVVVTDKAFLKTTDGGKSWKPITGLFLAPEIFGSNAGYAYFGWDATHDVLYASGLGASVYRFRVKGGP